MEKWLILELGWEIYKVSMEHLVGPESAEVLSTKITVMGNDGRVSQGHGSHLKEPPRTTAGTI